MLKPLSPEAKTLRSVLQELQLSYQIDKEVEVGFHIGYLTDIDHQCTANMQGHVLLVTDANETFVDLTVRISNLCFTQITGSHALLIWRLRQTWIQQRQEGEAQFDYFKQRDGYFPTMRFLVGPTELGYEDLLGIIKSALAVANEIALLFQSIHVGAPCPDWESIQLICGQGGSVAH